MTRLFECASSALVLIDLQHGIVARTLAPHASADVVQRCASLAAAMRARGVPVFYVNVDLTQMLKLPADNPVVRPPGPLPANACDIVPEAGMQDGDLRITKRQWGALYGTELDQLLRRRHIRTIVLAGIATNFGVESTARAAFDRGYELVFAEDAMSSMRADLHTFSVQNIFPVMGRVRSTAAILAELAT